MHRELADEIVLIAAPIFAVLLGQLVANTPHGQTVPAETMRELRRQAITQALALRRDVLSTEV
jgi:hypothetical protein